MNTHFSLRSIKQNSTFFGSNSAYFGNKIEVNFWITNEILFIFMQSAVVYEVERWAHTPNAVGSNPSAAVDCLP